MGRLISPMYLLGRVGRSGRCVSATSVRWVRPNAQTATREVHSLISPERKTHVVGARCWVAAAPAYPTQELSS